MGRRKVLISCEHAGNYIPRDYKFLFLGHEDVLETHRGYDPGAIDVAKYLARNMGAPLFYQKISRLLVETNRSPDNKELFSEYVQPLNKKIKEYLLKKYYFSYRSVVEERIHKDIEGGEPVLHISVHSFTPVLNGVERKVDLGILYDENRATEHQFCREWKEKLNTELDEQVVMLNVPYNGADDGFTTYLRKKFSEDQYVGIELEINQKYINTAVYNKIKESLLHTLAEMSTFISAKFI